jgi:hypothetical protein
MLIEYVNLLCKEDVHVCHTNFNYIMEQNSHGTIERIENNCFPRTLRLKTKVQQNINKCRANGGCIIITM